MPVDWDEIKKVLSPIKDDEDLRQRWRESFAYPIVRETFNFTLPRLAEYTRLLLGGDSRQRYTEYLNALVRIITELQQVGVRDILDLIARVETRGQWESFVAQSGVKARDIATLQKFLVFWLVPMKKYMSGLVREDAAISAALKVLGAHGMRTNLDLLQQGSTPAGRKALAYASGLPEATILRLVNMADFSRLPWASKATIANISGAGCASLAQLAAADPQQLYADFFRYGESIGKNLKLGNEIENSHRIAKIVPRLVQ
jgi:hypothetical protein